MKIFNKILIAVASLSLVMFAGCSNVLEEKDSSSIEYGSLIIGSDNRALSVSEIKSAIITVSGNGITTPIQKTCSSIVSGEGSIEITDIPVGINRIISVQAYSDSDATTKIDDAIISAVVDIVAGPNTLDKITWDTSRKGYIYTALFNASVDLSKLSSTEMKAIDTATPTCDATEIDLDLFVSDFKSGYANLKDASSYVKASDKTLKRLTVAESEVSSASAPVFVATAYFSDGTNLDVTTSATWTSSVKTVATVNKGSVTLLADGKTVITGKYTYGSNVKTGATQTVTVSSSGGVIDKLYFIPSTTWSTASPRYAAYFYNATENEWVSMESSNSMYVCSKPEKSYSSVIFCRMNPSSVENGWNNKWNQTLDLTIPTDKDTYKYDDGTWDKGSGEWLTDLSGSYQGGSFSASVVAGAETDPSEPTVIISPSAGEISVASSITVSYKENLATVTTATVTITGDASKTYSLNDFTNGSLSISLSSLNISEANKNINLSVSVTNSEGTTEKTAALTSVKVSINKDPFTWDNVLCYFVLTDRFYNGETGNDNSYYRTSGNSSNTEDVAKFHGGDIKGLTQKLDYLEALGINAIWITAPYEQAHGWVGGKNNAFPHYAFHGYYTLDWTYMDQNMGTIEEFRTFVNEAHKKGIRVVMDVVMNHVGYNNTEDMITYSYGKTSHTNHGWLAKTNGLWNANDTVEWTNSYWDSSWFGPWIRSFGYASGSEYGGSCGGLPDVKTELTSSVGMAPVLVTKWGQELDSTVISSSTGNTLGNKYGDYKLPSVSSVDWNGKTGNWRTDMNVAPADYQVMWLSAWVREFGIDGFRCDTAKHVEPYRWGQLKVACEAALEKWRTDDSKEDTAGAKNWTDNFWMTGECFGWTAINGSGGDYYGTGKFDSMINFSFNGSSGSTGRAPTTSDWSNYVSINSNGDDDSNGNRNSVLSYVSSHDTGLHRSTNTNVLGTMLGLLPGGVQIFYGDESARPSAYTSCGDADMTTRGDMNWTTPTHWNKIGTFRKYNPAVGAGTGSAYKRSYSGTAGDSKIAISISSTTVDVSGLYDNGTTVYNWYDGKSAVVSNGSATFSSSSASETAPVLVSNKNPSDYGVSF